MKYPYGYTGVGFIRGADTYSGGKAEVICLANELEVWKAYILQTYGPSGLTVVTIRTPTQEELADRTVDFPRFQIPECDIRANKYTAVFEQITEYYKLRGFGAQKVD